MHILPVFFQNIKKIILNIDYSLPLYIRAPIYSCGICSLSKSVLLRRQKEVQSRPLHPGSELHKTRGRGHHFLNLTKSLSILHAILMLQVKTFLNSHKSPIWISKGYILVVYFFKKENSKKLHWRIYHI